MEESGFDEDNIDKSSFLEVEERSDTCRGGNTVTGDRDTGDKSGSQKDGRTVTGGVYLSKFYEFSREEVNS